MYASINTTYVQGFPSAQTRFRHLTCTTFLFLDYYIYLRLMDYRVWYIVWESKYSWRGQGQGKIKRSNEMQCDSTSSSPASIWFRFGTNGCNRNNKYHWFSNRRWQNILSARSYACVALHRLSLGNCWLNNHSLRTVELHSEAAAKERDEDPSDWSLENFSSATCSIFMK